MKYTILHNIDAHWSRPYRQGDRLVKGYQGTIPTTVGWSSAQHAEPVFMIHNRDDRPDGQSAPSLSVGDVVILGEVAVTVASFGWEDTTVDPHDLHDGPYCDVVRVVDGVLVLSERSGA
jgi:hypothetical protein